MEQPIEKRKRAPAIAGMVLFLLILAALFAFSLPHAVELAKEVRTWGLSEIPAMLPTFEEEYNAAFPFRTDLINLNGLMARTLQKRELNGVYRYRNGFLGIPQERHAGTFAYAQNIARLNAYLQEQGGGTELAFIQFPCEETLGSEAVPTGLTDHSRENVDDLIAALRNAGVHTLDFSARMREAGFTMENTFFRTDHHWLPETAFWASGRLMEYLNATFGVTYDPAVSKLSNYHVDVYPRWSLGSEGKRTGTLFAGVDDFSVIYPKFETEMTTRFPIGDIVRTGSFYDVNIVQKALERRDYFGTITWFAYMGGDMPLVVQTNERAAADTHILMLKDSYSLPIQAFLSLHVKRLDAIDPRYYEGSLLEYIAETKPDIVLLCYNPWTQGEACFYTFGTEE